eukprot:gnl/TRDRNA2_/TRDRNA2_37939_c0_seq1.p1 gnl/TRDRNA2_/TRDRNA2_37939_c0~~gnl/TRDRNA2_/TRDRNA2_37939_c0_seq1.p1  ORF type:complete len:429 (-),score=73.75 gnl/TRDRNA2_/TRDRNA2_37939_c0_seq1:108-1394(-)
MASRGYVADPYALVNRAGNQHKKVMGRRKTRDPNNPADAAYMRAMHPDFDEMMSVADIDYKTRSQTDANFASKFRIPPLVECVRSFREHSNSVDAVCWGPDAGTFLSASHDATLKVWDAATGKCSKTLSGHTAGVYHCAVSSDRRLLLSCGSGEDKNALVWQWPQAKICQALQGHRRSVVHATFSSDGTYAATSDLDGVVAVHDLGRGTCKLQRSMHCGVAQGSACCREDPNLLCSAGSDGHIHLLDLREQSSPQFWRLASSVANYVVCNKTLSIPAAHDGYIVYGLEFTSRTTLFSCGADHKLKRWDLRMSPWTTSAMEYLGHTAPIRSLAVSPDQRFIVTGCEDGSSRLWHKDGLVSDGSATARRKDKSAPRSSSRALVGHVSLVSGVAWREDERRQVASVLSSSWDQSVQLFEISLQEEQLREGV